MIIDAHNHVGFDPAYLETRRTSELLNEMEISNVDKCIIFPFTTNPDIRDQNTIIKSAFEEYPDKFIGFFIMNPKLPEMPLLMQEYKEQGFEGITTDPRFGVGHDEKLFHDLVECAAVLGLPVYLHSDDKHTIMVPQNSIENLLFKYPTVKFILSSMYYDAIGIAARYKNVYLDTAAFELGQDLLRAIRPIGTLNIIMGANTPYGMLVQEINKINKLYELTKFQKRLIFSRNLNSIIG